MSSYSLVKVSQHKLDTCRKNKGSKQIDPITQTVKEKIACFNLLPLGLKQLIATCKLALVLANLVKFLALGFKAAYRLLSLIEKLCVPQQLIALLHKNKVEISTNKEMSTKDSINLNKQCSKGYMIEHMHIKLPTNSTMQCKNKYKNFKIQQKRRMVEKSQILLNLRRIK